MADPTPAETIAAVTAKWASISDALNDATQHLTEVFRNWHDLLASPTRLYVDSRNWYGSPGMRANQLERRAVAKAGRRARNGRAWAAFNGG